MTALINLTPHAINIILPSGKQITVAPSGTVARVSSTSEDADSITIDGEVVTIARPLYGEVEGIPAAAPDTFYIVSAMVKDRLTTRPDVIAPGTDHTAERNDKGQIVAIRRFMTR